MKAVIDRVEGELAVVLIGEKGEFKLNIPLSLLPEGSRESDILNISIERDSVETQAVKKNVSGLMERHKRKGRARRVSSRIQRAPLEACF